MTSFDRRDRSSSRVITTTTLLVMIAALAGCSSSSDGGGAGPDDSAVAFDTFQAQDGATDSGTRTDTNADGVSPDVAPDVTPDTTTADTTTDATTDTAPDTTTPCDPSSVAPSYAIGGDPGKSVMFAISADGRTDSSDGIFGTITEGGADIQLGESTQIGFDAYAVGGGGIHKITFVSHGVFTATRLGDAPGIDALGNDGTNLYGAGGLTLYTITASPLSITTVGTITPPAGCTKIIDVTVAGGIYFTVLDCGAADRIMSWVPSGTTLTSAGMNAVGPANIMGIELNTVVTTDSIYYSSSVGTGSITFSRKLSTCLGTPPRGL